MQKAELLMLCMLNFLFLIYLLDITINSEHSAGFYFLFSSKSYRIKNCSQRSQLLITWLTQLFLLLLLRRFILVIINFLGGSAQPYGRFQSRLTQPFCSHLQFLLLRFLLGHGSESSRPSVLSFSVSWWLGVSLSSGSMSINGQPDETLTLAVALHSVVKSANA